MLRHIFGNILGVVGTLMGLGGIGYGVLIVVVGGFVGDSLKEVIVAMWPAVALFVGGVVVASIGVFTARP